MAKWLNVSGKAIAEAQATTTNALKVPANAKKNKKDANDAFWRERLTIVSAGGTTLEKDGNEITRVAIRWRCADAGENPGREFTDFWPINWSHYPDGDSQTGWFGVSQRNMGRMQAVLRHVGILPDLPDGGYSGTVLDTAFPDGAGSPLVNKEIDVEIRQSLDTYVGEVVPKVWKILPNPASTVAARVAAKNVVTV
jgi:hypothetical protein